MIVDEKTRLKISRFYAKKNDIVQPLCELFHAWKDCGRAVKWMRMDNAGENQLLERTANGKDWKLNITPEYTARNTPQQNSVVEVGLATVAMRARAVMAAANVPNEI